jgi:hypothetical protein
VRTGPGQHLARRNIVLLPDQQITAEIGEQSLAIVDVGLIEAGAIVEGFLADASLRRLIIALVLVCEGFVLALFSYGGSGDGTRKNKRRRFGFAVLIGGRKNAVSCAAPGFAGARLPALASTPGRSAWK